MDDLQLGKLIQKVDSLAENVDLMRTENSADHRNVARRLDSIDEKLTEKAPQAQVDKQGDRIDGLESFKDKLWWIIPGMGLVATFLFGLLTHATGAG
jgi:hypothetical protein